MKRKLPVWILIRGSCAVRAALGRLPQRCSHASSASAAPPTFGARPRPDPDLPGNGCLHDQGKPPPRCLRDGRAPEAGPPGPGRAGDGAGWQHPVCVLAPSMGGNGGAGRARRHPHEVEGLVLGQQQRGAERLYRRLRPRQCTSGICGFDEPADASRVESVVLDMTSQQQLMPRDGSPCWKRLSIRQRHPVTRRNVVAAAVGQCPLPLAWRPARACRVSCPGVPGRRAGASVLLVTSGAGLGRRS